MKKLATIVCVAFAMSSCAISEENFPGRYGESYCKKMKSCARGDFDTLFNGIQDCVADTEDLVEAFMDVSEALGSEYDATSAGECISDLKSAECDEFAAWGISSSCGNVMN